MVGLFDPLFGSSEEKGEPSQVNTSVKKVTSEPETKKGHLYPMFTMDMLPKEPLVTIEAANIYRSFMLEIGFYDKSEISQKMDFVREEKKVILMLIKRI